MLTQEKYFLFFGILSCEKHVGALIGTDFLGNYGKFFALELF